MRVDLGRDRDEGGRPALIDEADLLVRQVLWILEEGRCYCCAAPATEVAHLLGRRYLRLRWDVEKDGNCHLMCRKCHRLDHDGHLEPTYARTFISRAGAAAMAKLVERSAVVAPLTEDDVFEIVERLRERVENPYATR
jgi:hypothetical protein